MSTQTYEDYLNWKNARYSDNTNAASKDTVVEMEPVGQKDSHPQALKREETEGVMDGAMARDKIDREVKDSTFINLKKESKSIDFAWRDVKYTVPVKTNSKFFARKTGAYKDILAKVSGYVKPGEILFVMGPSGAGKSSLLDALADRVKLKVDGVQWLDGQLKTEFHLKQVSKYVQQDDCIMGALTVKEVLKTASQFYIPEKEKREPMIEAVIKMVGLTNQIDTKVGDVFFRGLSGGQKRRLSIAIELLAQPQIMFLDEPTSGLDSAAAFAILSSLRRVAKSANVSLIVTIHQPSELLFELGDNLLLLANGKQVFFGPIVGPGNVEEHFNNMGYACPPRTSVADWLLDLVNADFGNPDVVQHCIDGWKGSPAETKLVDELQSIGVPDSRASAPPVEDKVPRFGKYATSQLTQTSALLKRGFINAMRAPAVIWLRFAMYFMLAILIGTVWLQLGQSAKVIVDINGCLFYTVAFMIFMSISVLPAYLDERNQFVRERANNGYSVGAYIISHTIFEIPFIFLLALVCSSTIYWLVGLVPDPNRFFIFVANLFMSLLVAESIMILISAIIPYFIVGIAVGAFLFGAFMCVMGYFVQFDSIGWWWKWMRYIAVHYYSFSTFMTNQYADQVYSAYCPIPTEFPCYPFPVDGNTIIAEYDLESRIWLNFVVMVIMMFGIRTIAALWLHFRVDGKK